MPEHRRRFSPQFKAEAVQMVIETGKPIAGGGHGSDTRRAARFAPGRARTFAATIAGLNGLGDWLAGHGVTLVGMEATGVYWKPVFAVLEPRTVCWVGAAPCRIVRQALLLPMEGEVTAAPPTTKLYCVTGDLLPALSAVCT